MSSFGQGMALLSGPPPGFMKEGQTLTSAGSVVVHAVYPLTRSQEGIWIEYLMEPSSTTYNLTLQWDMSSGGDDHSPTSITTILSAKLPKNNSMPCQDNT